jgi:PhnB protein
MTSYKPQGYPDISPYMILDDPEASMQFIEAMFGGQRLRVFLGDDGRIKHGEIRIGDAVLMMGASVPGWPAQQANFHHYVPDVDAVYARALQLGAVSIQEPARKDDPDKRGGFADPGGIVWWIATQGGQA